MKKQKGNKQKTIIQQLKLDSGFSSRDIIAISLSASAETKAPTQVEDGHFRLSTGFLEHSPVTSPPTNQKKLTHLAFLTLNFAYKYFFL